MTEYTIEDRLHVWLKWLFYIGVVVLVVNRGYRCIWKPARSVRRGRFVKIEGRWQWSNGFRDRILATHVRKGNGLYYESIHTKNEAAEGELRKFEYRERLVAASDSIAKVVAGFVDSSITANKLRESSLRDSLELAYQHQRDSLKTELKMVQMAEYLKFRRRHSEVDERTLNLNYDAYIAFRRDYDLHRRGFYDDTTNN